MKKAKNIFFDKAPIPPGASALLTTVAPRRRVWGAGGAACREKNIFLAFFMLLLFSNGSFAGIAPPQVCHKDNCINIEVVSKPEDMEHGLMDRAGLAADGGMLFLFKNDGIYKFWMKNMRFSLDMVWISATGRIVYIATHVPPCTTDPCAVYTPSSPARYVLEVNSGYSASHQWNVGDQLGIKGL